MKPLSECRLYTFIDTAYLGERSPADCARQLCDGGSDIIQLRAKTWGLDKIHRTAEIVLPILAAAGIPLVINDHPEVARAVSAPYCHLGQEDFFDDGPGSWPYGDRVRFGLSTHSPNQAERALAARPDYLAIGPVFPTPTKPGRPAVTLEYVRWAARRVEIPWFAIGGINLANVSDVVEAGARRICVVSAILGAQDPVRACQAFRKFLS